MLRREKVIELQILHKQDKSLKALVRETGHSINTIRRYVREGREAIYSARPTKPKKLESYENYIKARIAQAQPDWLAATVLCRELVGLGYTGSLSLLRGYLRTLKPLKAVVPLNRFETAPGEQMQVDFGSFRFHQAKFYAFVALLGYSRALYVEFVPNQQVETLLSCHEHAFAYFNGVPLKVLYDNMKAVILKRHAYGEGCHQWQPGFLDFAKHYGFTPKVCQPYRPQTKGKVERSIRYLRQSFYLPWKSLQEANSTLDLASLNQAVSVWLETVANLRLHATTKAKPIDLLAEEQKALQPLSHAYKKALPFNSPSASTLIQTHQGTLQHALTVYDALLGDKL